VIHDIGVIGLAVMGQNLVLNVERNGHCVAVHNRTAERTRGFLAGAAHGKRITAYEAPGALAASLARPRKILLMVKAGQATDSTLEGLWPHLEAGDIVMDGGNAHPRDTERRCSAAADRGIQYLGIGISGGEAGALNGPSIMVGGARAAYEQVRPLLERIAALGPEGPCCAYFGPGGAGHHVKMVHNGIEYAIMQALAEAYDVMRRGLGLSAGHMADAFGDWNRGDLSSYLVEITEQVLRARDSETGRALVDVIQDTAEQKGTGKWSSQLALDLGSPAPSIAAAVFARVVSSLKDEREAAAGALDGPEGVIAGGREEATADLHAALLCTVLAAYGQGLRQLQDAGREWTTGIDLEDVARAWMAGCIIRAKLLQPIAEAFRRDPNLPFLLIAEPFRTLWAEHQAGFRRTVSRAQAAGIPVPAMGSALAFVDAYRSRRLPANLIQAQRDFFGAHTYQRIDRTGSFHTEWDAA